VGVSAGVKFGAEAAIVAQRNANGTITVGGMLGGAFLEGADAGGSITLDPMLILSPTTPTIQQIDGMKSKQAQYYGTSDALKAQSKLVTEVQTRIKEYLIPTSTYKTKTVIIPGATENDGDTVLTQKIEPTQAEWDAAIKQKNPSNAWHLKSYLMIMTHAILQANEKASVLYDAGVEMQKSINKAEADRKKAMTPVQTVINGANQYFVQPVVTFTTNTWNTVTTGATNTWNTVSTGASNFFSGKW
jgi:hypothetical protein